MIDDTLLADLGIGLPGAVRMQRLVHALRAHFGCDAVALLRRQEDSLQPVAVAGLAHDALGRRFRIDFHPRLAAILAQREPVRFGFGSPLPDPYDGLLEAQAGVPLPVHDCVGVSLHVEGALWGALTFDALGSAAFAAVSDESLAHAAVLVEASVRLTRLEEDVRSLRQLRGTAASAPEADAIEDDDIVGHSAQLLELLHELDVVASSDLPVLLLGETGVGKELFARRLHRHSGRPKALVHVNCAALPESLAESELFGHVRGAFTGAGSERAGRFETASGGTIFLDEVGELPLPVQAKLLRTLQNGEVQRLGEDRPRRVDVRVIAATNRDLRQSVREGAFRADLYHRLSVYPVPIPPLRERGNDILLLAGRFLELNRARLGLRSLRLSTDAEELLLRYPWPGNVRELEHVVSRAAIKAVSRGAGRAEIVTLAPALLDLEWQSALARPEPGDPAASPVVSPQASTAATLRSTVEQCQREAIRQAVAAAQGNWALAARRLGLDPSNLNKLARRLGIDRQACTQP